MFIIDLTLRNPITGDSEAMIFQFDPVTLDQAKWNSAFPAVRARLDALVASSTPKEPPTW